MKDLVKIAQNFSKKRTNIRNKEKKISYSRPEYKKISEAPTMQDIVNIINTHPRMRNRLAAQALEDRGDILDSNADSFEDHIERLLKAGAKFNKKRVLRLIKMAVKEGTRLN